MKDEIYLEIINKIDYSQTEEEQKKELSRISSKLYNKEITKEFISRFDRSYETIKDMKEINVSKSMPIMIDKEQVTILKNFLSILPNSSINKKSKIKFINMIQYNSDYINKNEYKLKALKNQQIIDDIVNEISPELITNPDEVTIAEMIQIINLFFTKINVDDGSYNIVTTYVLWVVKFFSNWKKGDCESDPACRFVRVNNQWECECSVG